MLYVGNYASINYSSTYATYTGAWTAYYLAGEETYSIFRVTDSATPKTLEVGTIKTVDSGSSRTDYKSYVKTFGNNEAMRHTTLTSAFSYNETETAAM